MELVAQVSIKKVCYVFGGALAAHYKLVTTTTGLAKKSFSRGNFQTAMARRGLHSLVTPSLLVGHHAFFR